MAEDRRYMIGELWAELGRFEEELKAANLRPSTISSHVSRSSYFIRWLAGDYTPSGPR
jgi:hypothetical protein